MTYMIFLSSMILLLTIGTFAIQNSFADTTDFLENVPASIVRVANIVDTTSSLPIILELYTNNTDSTRAKQGDIITILLFMDTHFSNASATILNRTVETTIINNAVLFGTMILAGTFSRKSVVSAKEFCMAKVPMVNNRIILDKNIIYVIVKYHHFLS